MNKNLAYIAQIATALGTRALLTPLRLLPVKKNRVLFESFRGKQCSCNPLYVARALKEMAGDQVEIGWSLWYPEKHPELEQKGMRALRIRSLAFYRYALTARVICVNAYYKPTIPRRRGQFFLRTWHGGGAYKRVGKFEKHPFLKRVFIGMQQQGADLYLSSSRAFTEMTLREAFGYKGEVLESGMPRNDILVNAPDPAVVARARKALGLREGEKFVLYAPTYRDDALPRDFQLDHEALTKALSQRFGGAWKCAYRSHYITMFLEKGENSAGIINATEYPDMQELLLAADALITDYSSSMWDMSLTGKPVFLYCPDLKSYQSERDFFTDIHTWPFPLAESNGQLAQVIRDFDEDAYARAVHEHHEALGSCETGHAAYDAARRIMKECGILIPPQYTK